MAGEPDTRRTVSPMRKFLIYRTTTKHSVGIVIVWLMQHAEPFQYAHRTPSLPTSVTVI